MPDLAPMFELDENALELFLRTTIIYLGLIAAIRILGRREIGSLELPELLLIVLVADGVSMGMSGDYTSITGALIVGGTLLGWNALLSYLSFHSSVVRDLLRPKPLRLVEDGRYIRKNMRREMVTREELDSLLRLEGIDDVSEVKAASLEPEGQLSVIKKSGPDDLPKSWKRRAV